jgi:hypothetical protein
MSKGTYWYFTTLCLCYWRMCYYCREKWRRSTFAQRLNSIHAQRRGLTYFLLVDLIIWFVRSEQVIQYVIVFVVLVFIKKAFLS